MFNFQAVGFVVILGIVGIGLDYYQQTLKADLELGELSAGAYVETVTGRFGDVQEAKAAKTAERERKARVRGGARPYLPEAPEGWTRREWIAGDNSAITTPAREMSDVEKEALESSTLLKNMAAASAKRAEEDRNNQTWVYERGDEAISVRVRYSELPKGNTITANAMTMVVGNLSAMAIPEGWGVIEGVAYGTYNSFLSEDPKPYRSLNAVIGFGSEVKLEVRTNTTDEATREILTRIDYDGLNALLPNPLAHVGSGAREVPPAMQAEMATKMLEIRDDLIQQRTEAATQWLHSATSHGDAMTLALRSAGLNIDGSMGDADAALYEALDDVEAQAIAVPEEQASLSQSTGDQEAAAASETRNPAPQAKSNQRTIVSKRLPQQTIDMFQSLTGAERSIAMTGLEVSIRKFERENKLPEGSCDFSMVNFRIECHAVQQEAKAEESGGFLSLLKGGSDTPEPAPKAAPKRLKLSGGTSCLDNSLGGLCKN
ncbi:MULTISPECIES: hypothetical protein [unclassified Roseovarius]|uniref:hypothetical protein n=1 Tax=unclassified Roseovarius TaxID=2614913 RepID=UPI002740072A|nr:MULTISPECIES: hypothetical protein [unclassified Roseovarius]